MPDHVEAYGCLVDPLLDTGRCVYVQYALPTLLALARGGRRWAAACADGSLTATGEMDLCRRVTEWFTPLTASMTSAES